MAAAAKVRALPELLENILLQLPIRDLLFAQKVCKTFKQVMEESPSIQRALFFTPGGVGDVYQTDGKETAEQAAHTEYVRTKSIALNPLVVSDYIAYHYKSVGVLKGEYHFSEAALKARQNASCHRMWMSQPPMNITAVFTLREVETRDIDDIDPDELDSEGEPMTHDATFMVSTAKHWKFGVLAENYWYVVHRNEPEFFRYHEDLKIVHRGLRKQRGRR